MNTVKSVAFLLGAVVLSGPIECRPDAPIAKPKNLIITNVSYQFNNDMMDMKVSLRDGPDGIPVVDLDAELYEDIPKELYANFVISKKAANEYKPLIKTGVKNLCEFIKNPDREPILKILLTKLKEAGGLNLKCPMDKGKFSMNGFFIEASAFPAGAPTGFYKLELAISKKIDNKSIHLFSMEWHATLAFQNT